MNREDIIRMAREAGIRAEPGNSFADDMYLAVLYRFATLVEAHVNAKEKERQRYDIHSCGPDCDRYICVAVRNEREACAKACEEQEDDGGEWDIQQQCANAIRARSNT